MACAVRVQMVWCMRVMGLASRGEEGVRGWGKGRAHRQIFEQEREMAMDDKHGGCSWGLTVGAERLSGNGS